jgi:hypothetical protein
MIFFFFFFFLVMWCKMEVTWTYPHQGRLPQRNRELVVLGEAVDEVAVHHAGVGGKEGAAGLLLGGGASGDGGIGRGSAARNIAGEIASLALANEYLGVSKTELVKTLVKVLFPAGLQVAHEGQLGALGEERGVARATGESLDKSLRDPGAARTDLGNHPLLVEQEGRTLGSVAGSMQNLIGRVGSTRLVVVNTRRRMDGI